MIPTGKRGRPPKSTTKEQRTPSSDLEKLTHELNISQQHIKELEKTIQKMKKDAEQIQKDKEVRSREIEKIIQSLQKLE